MGPGKFAASETALHQAFSKPVVFRQQKVGDDYRGAIVYPEAVATAKLQMCAMQ